MKVRDKKHSLLCRCIDAPLRSCRRAQTSRASSWQIQSRTWAPLPGASPAVRPCSCALTCPASLPPSTQTLAATPAARIQPRILDMPLLYCTIEESSLDLMWASQQRHESTQTWLIRGRLYLGGELGSSLPGSTASHKRMSSKRKASKRWFMVQKHLQRWHVLVQVYCWHGKEGPSHRRPCLDHLHDSAQYYNQYTLILPRGKVRLQRSCSTGCQNPAPCWTRQIQARPNQPWARCSVFPANRGHTGADLAHMF